MAIKTMPITDGIEAVVGVVEKRFLDDEGILIGFLRFARECSCLAFNCHIEYVLRVLLLNWFYFLFIILHLKQFSKPWTKVLHVFTDLVVISIRRIRTGHFYHPLVKILLKLLFKLIVLLSGLPISMSLESFLCF